MPTAISMTARPFRTGCDTVFENLGASVDSFGNIIDIMVDETSYSL
jgi:hypothetical protein